MATTEDGDPPGSTASSGLTEPKPKPGVRPDPTGKRLAVLSLAATGVVYGDIGTSPLYAIRECFHGEYGIAPTPSNILGVLSLMFWALILVVSVKYLGFILRADNRGEGGVIALTAQLRNPSDDGRANRFLVGIGLFAAALLYGDGMITPAISVVSAIEGVGVAFPDLKGWIIPIALAVLIALFLAQRLGTRGVGALFGPVMLIWFVTLAVLGIVNLVAAPQVLAAISPIHAVDFLRRNSIEGFLVLGAVFLVVTGAEALFADMGHFGTRPIRLPWYGFVLPSLLCNYFGQAAVLYRRPAAVEHPFYALVPDWATVPLIVLATVATVIASQAVISGAFSLTRQAIQMGYLPRMNVVHTSPSEIGQIYIPQVNWILLVSVVALVLGFRSSSQLAAAYGVAVTATMTITSILFFSVARRRWGWRLRFLVPLTIGFLVVDLAFFGANVSKIMHGAWFPLLVGGIVFGIMTTWRKGRRLLAERLHGGSPRIDQFLKEISEHLPRRVPGKAIYLASEPLGVPAPLLINLERNKVLHEHVAILNVQTQHIPRVERADKVQVYPLGEGFWGVTVQYGFMEEPNVPYALALAREEGLDFELDEVVFFLGRESIVPHRRPVMSYWREGLFAFLSRNAMDATRFFKIPPDQVVEVGARVEI
jgi:KUP system potassium uptake protein